MGTKDNKKLEEEFFSFSWEQAAFNLIHFFTFLHKIKSFNGKNLKNIKHKPKQCWLHETAESLKQLWPVSPA